MKAEETRFNAGEGAGIETLRGWRNMSQGQGPRQSNQARQNRSANGVGRPAQQYFLRDQRHRGTKNQPRNKATEMRNDIAVRVESKQSEQHDSAEHAADDVFPGFGVLEPK